ncbi:MAG: hypothetical protein AAGB22_00150 [Bacteroidota bacterium]
MKILFRPKGNPVLVVGLLIFWCLVGGLPSAHAQDDSTKVFIAPFGGITAPVNAFGSDFPGSANGRADMGYHAGLRLEIRPRKYFGVVFQASQAHLPMNEEAILRDWQLLDPTREYFFEGKRWRNITVQGGIQVSVPFDRLDWDMRVLVGPMITRRPDYSVYASDPTGSIRVSEWAKSTMSFAVGIGTGWTYQVSDRVGLTGGIDYAFTTSDATFDDVIRQTFNDGILTSTDQPRNVSLSLRQVNLSMGLRLKL